LSIQEIHNLVIGRRNAVVDDGKPRSMSKNKMKERIHTKRRVFYKECYSCANKYEYIVKVPSMSQAYFCADCIKDVYYPNMEVYKIQDIGEAFWRDAFRLTNPF
jgi:hypothetical protein